MSGAERWGHAEEEQPDQWTGSFSTEEEAIDDGRSNYEGDFWVQCGTEPDVTKFLPDGGDIIEMMSDRAYDDGREAASEYPDVGPDGRKALAAILNQMDEWARTYTRPTFWVADGAPRKVSA